MLVGQCTLRVARALLGQSAAAQSTARQYWRARGCLGLRAAVLVGLCTPTVVRTRLSESVAAQSSATTEVDGLQDMITFES